jgi:hypothetical protein
VAVALVATSLAAAPPAEAQSRHWLVCGGNAFNTCASVELHVVGTSVTVRVWNLSGVNAVTYAGTVFTAIGFENVGTAMGVAGSLSMSGPARGSDSPQAWVLSGNQQVGGGVKLDLASTTGTGVDNGISSACASESQLPGGSNQLWQNPCGFPSGSSDPGWVTITFQITGTWDVASTYLLIKGQNGPDGPNDSTQCITGGNNVNCQIVPEPITMVLLGTGLAGVGGVGFLRRRRGAEVGS